MESNGENCIIVWKNRKGKKKENNIIVTKK